MSRTLIAAAFGLAAAFTALVLYAGVAIWLFSRELPPASDVAIGFDPVAMPLWMCLALGAIFAAGFVVTYRHVK
ncbi:MAG: hypothetical protein M3P27_00090 [Acidobacteriota bacterium]|nr:hypothetical protein [Acidobacteriota bacterium]